MAETALMENWKEDLAKLMLRLVIGGTMILHGIGKVVGDGVVDFIRNLLVENGLPGALVWGVFVGELIAPVFLILGIFTRVAAGLIAVTMIFAVLLVHLPDFFTLNQGGGWTLEIQALFYFSSLAVMLLGGGRFAVLQGNAPLN